MKQLSNLTFTEFHIFQHSQREDRQPSELSVSLRILRGQSQSRRMVCAARGRDKQAEAGAGRPL